MNNVNKSSWWRTGVSLVGLIGAGIALAGSVPALADPPNHAPAWGYRRNQDRDRDNRWRSDRNRRVTRYYRRNNNRPTWNRDRDSNRLYRNRGDRWNRDRDRDLSRNRRDHDRYNRHR